MTKNQGPTLWGYVFMGGEPAKDPAVLVSAVERLARDVGLAPSKMFVTTSHGRAGRPRKFTAAGLREAAASEEVGSAYLSWAGKDREEITVRYYLRHNHRISMRFQGPALHYTMMPLPEDAAARHHRVAAVERFLVDASAPFAPLHGAIAAAFEHNDAADEITMSAEARFGPDSLPVRHRRDFDQRATEALWTRARGGYWTALLGPELAAAAGADAARAAGAARVEPHQDWLIVQSTPDVADALALDASARTRALRRWLWPHTIQNPADRPD